MSEPLPLSSHQQQKWNLPTDSSINRNGYAEEFGRLPRDSKARAWKFERRIKPKSVSEKAEDTLSPLLNPNAIHKRRSLQIDEDWIYEEEESNLQTSNRNIECDPTRRVHWDTLTSTLSPNKTTLTEPLIRVLSPSFAKHTREFPIGWESHDLDSIQLGQKKETYA